MSLRIAGLAILLTFAAGTVEAQPGEAIKGAGQTLGHGVKHAGKTVGHGLTEGAHKTGHALSGNKDDQKSDQAAQASHKNAQHQTTDQRQAKNRPQN